MSDRDLMVAVLLDRLVPVEVERGDWGRVIADAGIGTAVARGPRMSRRLRGRRRLVLLAAIVLAAVLIPLAALAVGQGWWFLGVAPKAVSPVEVVKTGTWSGINWSLVAYRSSTDGICWGVTPEGDTAGASLGCAPVVGVPSTAVTKKGRPLSITYGFNDPGIGVFPRYISGPVVSTATEVAIVLDDGTTIATPTIASPPGLQSDVRFYVSRLPGGEARPARVIGRDQDGKTVATLKVNAIALASPSLPHLTRHVPRFVTNLCASAGDSHPPLPIVCPPLVPITKYRPFPGSSGVLLGNTSIPRLKPPLDRIYLLGFNGGDDGPVYWHWIAGMGSPQAIQHWVLSDADNEVKGKPAHVRTMVIARRKVEIWRFPAHPAGGQFGSHYAAITPSGPYLVIASIHGSNADNSALMAVALARKADAAR